MKKLYQKGKYLKNSFLKELVKRSGLLDEEWYMQHYSDLTNTNIDPFMHYLLFGWKEGRKPNQYFDTNWYIENNVKYLKICPIIHYMFGWKRGLNPSMQFKCSSYIAAYPDVSKAKMEPLKHYLQYGRKEGRQVYGEPILVHSTHTPSPTDNKSRVISQDSSAKVIEDPQLRALLDNEYCELDPKEITFSSHLNIHWVIPDFASGAGGHMTIFRTIRYLETFGHDNTIWIYNPTLHQCEDSAYQDIVRHFQLVKADIKFTHDDTFSTAEGDIVFATDWGSVSYVNSLSNFKRRFYFVQDHEPEFYATGSQAIAARDTYSYDLDCICASPWLKELMESQYGRWAREFWLAVDSEIYSLSGNKERNTKQDVVRIAFYARHFTSRRAVELGLLALEALAEKTSNIEVHCFGAPLLFDTAPFKCIDHGICTTKDLADIYKQCDLGIVFSATNYSLIPQEMMACGLPVCELNVESTRAIFPDGVVTLLSTNPREMAKQLATLVSDANLREIQSKLATAWVSSFTWEKSAKAVESALFERLNECGYDFVDDTKSEVVKASVIIPTYNAGGVLQKVLDMLQRQKAPWTYEVVVVDSGSTDGTVELLETYQNVKLHKIPNSEFQHGRTRNLAISKTRGEFIAVITQDALPVNEYWLYDLVSSLEHYPNAAGVFGKHLAWPDADPYTKRELVNHFNNFDNNLYCVSKFTDEKKWNKKDRGWQQFLHFYSDNNSCMRRSVWEVIPYPEIKFGEDQAWAWKIIKSGYQKVYSKHAMVYHSHDFDEGDVQKRAFEEAEFFRDEFGYQLIALDKVESTINAMNNNARKIARELDIAGDVLERKIKANRAKIVGFNKAN